MNDLYVKEAARGKGIGEKLLKRAITFAEDIGAKGVLETAEDNITAQRLYEKNNFKRERNRYYFYTI
ncbi:GNAT family N-acetyltransferase [Bacillus sp. SCS-151]|uniref:GNAT family N-acetyltransferase n=1 Tax=Nanhaiella sioensis TaxID=3115293 RepID=UPI00397C07DA